MLIGYTVTIPSIGISLL